MSYSYACGSALSCWRRTFPPADDREALWSMLRKKNEILNKLFNIIISFHENMQTFVKSDGSSPDPFYRHVAAAGRINVHLMFPCASRTLNDDRTIRTTVSFYHGAHFLWSVLEIYRCQPSALTICDLFFIICNDILRKGQLR